MNIALLAQSPHDAYVIDNTQPVYPKLTQSTDFSIDQKYVQFGNAPFIGRTHRVHLNPRTLDGDVVANMHLKLTLPQLAQGFTYCDNIGRNLVKSYTLYIDEVEVQRIDAEWLVIQDDIMLDDDEKSSLFQLINEGEDVYTDEFKRKYAANPHPVNLIVPLEFFFCRRHSPYKSQRERTSKPFLPLAALWRQNVYIDIEFYPQSFFTNAVGNPIDLVGAPELIVETCTLTPEEYMGIRERPHRFIITQVYKEPTTDLISSRDGKFTFTAKFPVSLTTWFFRKKEFEDVRNNEHFDNRFQFGYSYTENNRLRTRDPFQILRLYINNEDSTPQIGGVFFKHIQALNYNLSTPSNEIYMYSFGKFPKEYRIDTTIRFESSFIEFGLVPEIALDVLENYTFNVYHLGYTEVQIVEGRVLRVG